MITIVDCGPNKMEEIGSVWAVLSVDASGREGVCATKTDFGWIPLFTGDPDKVDMIAQIGSEIAEGGTAKTRLVRFTTREEVREL